MRTAYSYARFSSKKQAHGTSLERQLEDARAYAQEHELALDESFRDLGISAFSGANLKVGALGKFIELVRQGQVRLSRDDVIDALSPFIELLRAGIEIVTLVDEQRYSAERLKGNFAPLMHSLIAMANANEESRKKSKRSLANWEFKRQAAASGTVATKATPAWIRVVDGRAELIPERAEVVRQIFQRYVGGAGVYTIARDLNEAGVPTFGRAAGGKKSAWHRAYVRKILRSEAARGSFVPHQYVSGVRKKAVVEPIEGYFPEAVDDVLWHSANERLDSNAEGLFGKATVNDVSEPKSGGRKGKRFANLFSKLAYCYYCGNAMRHASKTHEKGGSRLICSGATVGVCDHRKHWHYDRTERAVVDALQNVDWKRAMPQPGGSPADAAARRVAEIQAELAKIEGLIEEWSDLKDKGSRTASLKILKLEADQDRLLPELKTAEQAQREAAEPADPRDRIELIEQLYAEQADATNDAERYLLRAKVNSELRRVVDRLEFSDDDVVAFYSVRPRRGFTMFEDYNHIGFSLMQRRTPIFRSSGDPDGPDLDNSSEDLDSPEAYPDDQ